jgi:hypothetical protein
LLRKARNADGSLLFLSNEYLTSQQITSFFSRTAAKKSIQVTSLRILTSMMTMTLKTCSPPWQRKSLSKCRKKYWMRFLSNTQSHTNPITYAKWPPRPSFQGFL